MLANNHQLLGSNSRLVLLGTGGGPSIKKARAQPSNALIIEGRVYIIDAGNGVSRQMALANISPKDIQGVFITHNHSDHVADYGTLLLRAWQSGLQEPVHTFGPTPLEEMTSRYLEYMKWVIEQRTVQRDRPHLKDLILAQNISNQEPIFEDGGLTVSATEVSHGTLRPAYAFRFQTPSWTVVFSGDTTRSDNLCELARDADILVHEAINPDAVDSMVEQHYPGNDSFRRALIEGHTPVEEVGQLAEEAGVKKLVLTHLVPSGMPDFDRPEIWLDGARKHFHGDIVVGEDLLEMEISPQRV